MKGRGRVREGWRREKKGKRADMKTKKVRKGKIKVREGLGREAGMKWKGSKKSMRKRREEKQR